MNYPFDPVAYADRQAEIAKMMARTNAKRVALGSLIASSDFDLVDARRRNASMPGILGELWTKFLDMESSEQLKALEVPEFQGMAWQSLLQCDPIFRLSK